MNLMDFNDMLKHLGQHATAIRDHLLAEADARYKRKLDDLQREYASERQSISNAFGDLDMPKSADAE